MKTYRPGQVQTGELRLELQNLQQASMRPDKFVELVYQSSEPAKLRPGMVVMADGTNWNPGSGEGMYRRDAANSSWVFIG